MYRKETSVLYTKNPTSRTAMSLPHPWLMSTPYDLNLPPLRLCISFWPSLLCSSDRAHSSKNVHLMIVDVRRGKCWWVSWNEGGRPARYVATVMGLTPLDVVCVASLLPLGIKGKEYVDVTQHWFPLQRPCVQPPLGLLHIPLEIWARSGLLHTEWRDVPYHSDREWSLGWGWGQDSRAVQLETAQGAVPTWGCRCASLSLVQSSDLQWWRQCRVWELVTWCAVIVRAYKLDFWFGADPSASKNRKTNEKGRIKESGHLISDKSWQLPPP